MFVPDVVLLEAKTFAWPGITQLNDGRGYPDAVQFIIKLFS